MKTLYKLLFVLFASLCSFSQVSAQVFPAGFQATRITGGLNPTDLKFSPDGQYLFIADKTGKIFLVENDQLRTTPVLDLTSVIDDGGERGLTHLAFDPDFATNEYVYIYYTLAIPGNTHSPNRVSRFSFIPLPKC
ncbi:PQQ-dependent sugar dehydrogenase [Paraflavitalea speifideaquila]|uniref:PQQ-dependent sugar dehydrogenase n=1 Tax=Paraflavitalea speifideaquila TaxID=3076558 RepID=UPI0028E24F31|nr:PQQ-dependent sugar dehydrogenase [Paraflavitalea speifideiaquila]